MNTLLLTLAVICVVAAVFGACRRDAPTAAAGTVGALLFAILAIMTGDDERRDC